MRVWRIATAAQQFTATNLSGAGAARSPGRWNDLGVAMVYCAENRSLAMLETLVHVPAAGLPQNRYLIAIDIPESVWLAREALEPGSVNQWVPTWDAIPAASISSTFGSEWVRQGRSAVLCVPSVIVPEECCVLLNPAHLGEAGITAQVVRRVTYETAWRRPGSFE